MSETQASPNRRQRGSRPEINTADMPVGQAPSIILPGDGGIANREPEEIAVVDTPMHKKYADDLAFMEETMEIMLNQSSEPNPPWVIDVYVNGRAEWIPVGRPYRLKRKFVEVLVRSKADAVSTEVIERPGEDPQNKINRNTRANYTFSVLHDPNPKGIEWLRRLMIER